jgi:hypothetical protein
MPDNWSNWKRLPGPEYSGAIEAPMGPGVYEVRRISTGAQVAFGAAPDVARSLSALRLQPSLKSWMSRLRQQQPTDDFEYRTCVAATPSVAKHVAEGLRGRRRAYLTRRVGLKGGPNAPSFSM